MLILYRKNRHEELSGEQLYCQVLPIKIVPKKDSDKGLNYTKPCGAVYGQYDKVDCDKWIDGSCDYIIYMGDVPDILKMLKIDS